MMILNSEELIDKFCTISETHHLLKSCYSVKNPDENIKLIYGYCPIHNCLFIYYGQTNTKSPYIEITTLFLKPKNLLPKNNTRSYKCSECKQNSLSNIKIGYYKRRPFTIGTAIICDNCNNLYHFNGKNAFLPLKPGLTPIYLL